MRSRIVYVLEFVISTVLWKRQDLEGRVRMQTERGNKRRAISIKRTLAVMARETLEQLLSEHYLLLDATLIRDFTSSARPTLPTAA